MPFASSVNPRNPLRIVKHHERFFPQIQRRIRALSMPVPAPSFPPASSCISAAASRYRHPRRATPHFAGCMQAAKMLSCSLSLSSLAAAYSTFRAARHPPTAHQMRRCLPTLGPASHTLQTASPPTSSSIHIAPGQVGGMLLQQVTPCNWLCPDLLMVPHITLKRIQPLECKTICVQGHLADSKGHIFMHTVGLRRQRAGRASPEPDAGRDISRRDEGSGVSTHHH